MDIRGVWSSRAVLPSGLHIGFGRAGAFCAHSLLLLIIAASHCGSTDPDPIA
jgi:hypothetical protein